MRRPWKIGLFFWHRFLFFSGKTRDFHLKNADWHHFPKPQTLFLFFWQSSQCLFGMGWWFPVRSCLTGKNFFGSDPLFFGDPHLSGKFPRKKLTCHKNPVLCSKKFQCMLHFFGPKALGGSPAKTIKDTFPVSMSVSVRFFCAKPVGWDQGPTE